ncbi:MAG: DedA family protein [Myxococcales bacterium]|nr:DedA family protein [Myxococcales bacterium]
MSEFINAILALPRPLVWAILGLAAGIEYVFPPFPGDVVTLVGSVIVGSEGLNIFPVFVFITAGGLAGAWLDFEFGRWVASPGDNWLKAWFRRPRVKRNVDRVRKGFEKHGDLYLVVNRFLPGIRALFFVAAGMVGFSRRRTLLAALIGTLLWNGLILAAGLSIGANLDELVAFVDRYTTLAWIGLAVIAAAILGRFLWKKFRSKSSTS